MGAERGKFLSINSYDPIGLNTVTNSSVKAVYATKKRRMPSGGNKYVLHRVIFSPKE